MEYNVNHVQLVAEDVGLEMQIINVILAIVQCL